MRKNTLMSTSFTLREFSPHEPVNTLRSSSNTSLTFLKLRPKTRGEQAGDLRQVQTPHVRQACREYRHLLYAGRTKSNQSKETGVKRLRVSSLPAGGMSHVITCASNGWAKGNVHIFDPFNLSKNLNV